MMLLFLLSTAMVSGRQADDKRLSPWVRQVLADRQNNGMRRTEGQRACFLTAFVQTDGSSAAPILSEFGGKVYAQLGDIAIATLPLDKVEELSAHPLIRRIEANRTANVTMDTTGIVVNALPVYEKTAQHDAFTGKGVVLGIMDVGFDLTHPNFYDDQARSHYRIGAFWDQLSTDTVGSPFPVGRDYVGAETILAQGCSANGKTQGHGTHTLGIAAGSGYDTPYRGIAYESDLCVVCNAVSADTVYIDQSDYYKYTSATDALGFKYLFDYAESQGKPCVASFSEGYSPYIDHEDSLYADFLGKLCGPGRIIVASAGNESLNTTYAEKPVGTEVAGAFIRLYKKSGNYRIKTNGAVNICLYAYANGDGTPSHTLRISSADPRIEQQLQDTLFIQQDTCAVSLIRYPSAFDGDVVCFLQLSGNKDLSKLPPIALVAEGRESRVQIFGNSSNLLTNRDTDPRWNAAAYGHNVLAPGCFFSTVCVGSTTHRLGYTSFDGQYHDASFGGEKGLWSTFSSTGPTMDGMLKPDVTAPGGSVLSSYNSYYMEEHPEETGSYVAYSKVGERTYPWSSGSGTSMSCPVVAGIVALWLQANPTLTGDDVMEVLKRTCQHPDKEMAYPNNYYGYGEIDGYAGLLDILGISKVEAVSRHQPSGVRIWAGQDALHLDFAVRPSSPVTVSLYSLQGTLLFQQQLKATAAPEATLPLPVLAAGVYAVQLSGGGSEVTGSQLIRL
jgi:subtilisin family serine protease